MEMCNTVPIIMLSDLLTTFYYCERNIVNEGEYLLLRKGNMEYIELYYVFNMYIINHNKS